MHTVAVLAVEHVVSLDLATPIEVFSRARLPDGRSAYRVIVCSAVDEIDTGHFTLKAPYGLDRLREADTVLIAGASEAAAHVPGEVIDALRAAAQVGTRIASICSGAFILAATGLLDGMRATTHWAAAPRLAEMYPRVEVDPDVLYVDNGQVLTSAGAAAGLDLCLHMIRKDYGSAVAADVARLSVMPLERDGGQAQFIVHAQPALTSDASLEPVLRWLDENVERDLTLDEIAARANMSSRTLNRRFRAQTGTTPLKWLHKARIRRAQFLLETTPHSVERIASQSGFGSPTAFRDHFNRAVGVSPRAYRRSFRPSDASAGSARELRTEH